MGTQDYNITYYCAEFVNSITNLMFIWLGIRGIRDCIRFRHRPVFVIACIGYIVVGLGSIAFHTTLKYSMQLADELPMIYATCIIGHATFSYGKSPATSRLIGVGLFGLGLLITVVYHVTKEPVFHQVSFACLTIAVVFRSMYDMEYTLRPALKIRSPERASAIMLQMWEMCLSGISLFLVGFFIWNMDNIFCLYLRSWRDILLLPWAVVLEGHAWWHIFTGLGCTYTPGRGDNFFPFLFFLFLLTLLTLHSILLHYVAHVAAYVPRRQRGRVCAAVEDGTDIDTPGRARVRPRAGQRLPQGTPS